MCTHTHTHTQRHIMHSLSRPGDELACGAIHVHAGVWGVKFQNTWPDTHTHTHTHLHGKFGKVGMNIQKWCEQMTEEIIWQQIKELSFDYSTLLIVPIFTNSWMHFVHKSTFGINKSCMWARVQYEGEASPVSLLIQIKKCLLKDLGVCTSPFLAFKLFINSLTTYGAMSYSCLLTI